jgi:hypothetical protein
MSGRVLAMYVYFMKAKNRMKIGKANNPEERLKELQVGCPFPLSIIAKIPCRSERESMRMERLMHKYFAKYHKQGEWFKCTPWVMNQAWGLEHAADAAQTAREI